MASSATTTTMGDVEQQLLGIRHILWGFNDIDRDIFSRWAQGFKFSSSEPSALEQWEGGPCAVIAPVQAFILKNLLVECRDFCTLREHILNAAHGGQVGTLVGAICEILEQCCADSKFRLVYLGGVGRHHHHHHHHHHDILDGVGGEVDGVEEEHDDDLESDGGDVDQEVRFHRNLKVHICTTLDDVRRFYSEHCDSVLLRKFGVLLFLYSVIATKGVDYVRAEIDTSSDSLIDDTYGYGSQSLINLMITGRATTYVWDHEQDVGGLKLQGLMQQSKIGFVTLMEHLRYCTVGSYYKNPSHPVWVMASDTHLTVLFSDEWQLVSAHETSSERARRIFKSYDPEGNNFISGTLLADVLADLELVSEDAYVEIMRQKMDPEQLGIILLNAFMDEFFPRETTSTPDQFRLVHYNGLLQSNVIAGQIRYHVGKAILLETSDLRAICESNAMLTVLQTKWPRIDVAWDDNFVPSLN